MIKRTKSSLFAKIFIITFLFTSLCCMITYRVISYLVPATYSTTLDTSLNNEVNSFLAEIEGVTAFESGKLFDEFILNHNGVLIQLFDSSNNEIKLPTQDSSNFPVLATNGIAIESDDPAAYRAMHSYIFTFAASDEVYTLTVAGSAQEVNLLKDTLGGIFLVVLFAVLLVAVLASIIYTHYVTKPILHINDVARKIAGLDFSWQCKEGRTDELGTLSHSLNEMSQKLSVSMAELKSANQKLQADIEHERALEQVQLDFFSAVSHELKTPITVIKGQTEGMILNIGDYQNHAKYLMRSLEIINTMENMVQEILTISRIKSSQIKLKKDNIPFSDMIKQEYPLFEDLIIKKELDWQENVASDLYIIGDRSLIQKAINNLISNAITYSPDYNSIFLTAFSKDGTVHFSLENTGVHIPDGELPKLFDPFYRLEYSRSKKTGGSGLGLYIVKTILEQHQAEYRIENTNRGVLFTIKF